MKYRWKPKTDVRKGHTKSKEKIAQKQNKKKEINEVYSVFWYLGDLRNWYTHTEPKELRKWVNENKKKRKEEVNSKNGRR